MVEALFGTTDFSGEHLVLPIWQNAQLLACLGWSQHRDDHETKVQTHSLGPVRRCFLAAHELEKARRDAHCLRWLLARTDRAMAVAAPDGELLGASLSAVDLFQEMRFGSRHFLRVDPPKLPPALVGPIGKAESGQVRLAENCTARFENLGPSQSIWLPEVGIECFTDSRTGASVALSRLTPVERDIYAQIVKGATNREIAQRRGTSYATVKNQVSTLLCKVGVARRINLLATPVEPQFLQAKLGPDAGEMISVSR